MAIMRPKNFIPDENYDPRSHEEEMFNILKMLPSDYYVFYSTIFDYCDNRDTIYYHEADFIVFNPQKGILVIEAKAGSIYTDEENRFYRIIDGKKQIMKHGGPFKQSAARVRDLLNIFGETITKKCKILNAVWFYSMERAEIDKNIKTVSLNKNKILTKESRNNIKVDIDNILNLKSEYNIQTYLTENETKNILDKLSQSCNLIQSMKTEKEDNEQIFIKLINEQKRLLNYLQEQREAIINGCAGTGKTLIAVEKARRLASKCNKGEKILFLCYNVFLQEFLELNNKNELGLYVDFLNLDKLLVKYCGQQDFTNEEPNYDLLVEKIEKTNGLGYSHVIIDEGQDFGKRNNENIDRSRVIQALKSEMKKIKGTFYMFYDKNQKIQSSVLPEYIQDADCKLTLYKNCRNTKFIAETSNRLMKIDMELNIISGRKAEIYIEQNNIKAKEYINRILDYFIDNNYLDIVILTCKTEKNSIINQDIIEENGRYLYIYKYHNFQFTTCRKFKGLEKSAVILIDADKNTFMNDKEIFYVGSSRAKEYLFIVANLDNIDCRIIADSIHDSSDTKNPQKALKERLNCLTNDNKSILVS